MSDDEDGAATGLDDGRRTIAIAGASGFVGQAFIERFGARHELVGLSRRVRADDARCRWRACDVYSLLDTERALAGCDVAIYLVHSMMPSARLTQASFRDLDLVLADNFGRGAARAGVERIVYLGGLIPPSGPLSEHLASRREVERALAAHGVPVTSLRAGLVVGAGGSSFQILRRLVERLPAMLLPSWTGTRTQPIALDDVVTLLERAALEQGPESHTHDVGGPDVLTYREMMRDTAQAIGRRPAMVDVPLLSPRLSRMWVSLVTGESLALVGPLVESLRHEMVARDRGFQLREGIVGMPWKSALKRALERDDQPGAAATHTDDPLPVPAEPRPPLVRRAPGRTVRSVQRLPRPPSDDAVDVGRDYLRWLPRLLWPLVRVDVEGPRARFRLWPLRRPLLEIELSERRSTRDRALFYVEGGLLAVVGEPHHRKGRLEFRLAPNGRDVIAALHDFVPRLPWFIYVRTQARVHLWVMRRFAHHLARRAETPVPTEADRPRLPAGDGLGP